MIKGEKISSLNELEELFCHAKHVKLFGAGLRFLSFMEIVSERNISFHADCVLVTSAKGNPDSVFGIPVLEVSHAPLHNDDIILLTISDAFVEAARIALAKQGITKNIYQIDYVIIDRIPYTKVYQAVKAFVKTYPSRVMDLNRPIKTEKKYVWSCWWQGAENAPELVKKCWESQRKKIPKAEHIIITWDNYRKYVELPEYIVDKVRSGKLLLAHFADILRCCLLYRYGGIWLDATVYMTDYLPEEYFEYELITRSTGEKVYCTNVSWVTWFLGGKIGEELYRFIMEAFFYYFREHDEILHYYMIDYLIAIACQEIAGIEKKLGKIPVNNKSATELQKHLREIFEENSYHNYIEGGFLQKLTYKGIGYQENSIYWKLMHTD